MRRKQEREEQEETSKSFRLLTELYSFLYEKVTKEINKWDTVSVSLRSYIHSYLI